MLMIIFDVKTINTTTMKNNIKYISLLIFSCLLLTNSPLLLAKTIKIATISPEGTFWMKQMRAGAKKIKDKTNGRVKFKFYPGGVMGNDESVLRKIRVGQLQGGAVTIGNLAKISPDTTVYGFPLLFSSLQEAAEIRKTTDPILSAQIEKDGFVNFGFAQGGFTYLMSKDPITRAEDLKKHKSWIPENNDVGLAVFRKIGATPVTLSMSDVLTGLQTDLIDTLISSPIGALALQWHTHIQYVTDEPINYLTALMIIDKRVFYKLSDADQKIVREVMSEVYQTIDKQNMTDNMAAREAMINQGVKFVALAEGEKARWLDIRKSVINEMNSKYTYNKAFYDATLVNLPDSLKMH